jgi:hypothetical protein
VETAEVMRSKFVMKPLEKLKKLSFCRFIHKVGWDAKLVNKSYPWVEKQIVHRPKVAPWQVVVRDSLLDLGVAPFNGFTYDHIYGTKFGGTIFDQFGRRQTAAELLASADPRKLTVLVHATVQKVLFDISGMYNKLNWLQCYVNISTTDPYDL